MKLVNAFVGLIQLIIALLLAGVALYIGYSTFSKITKGMDEAKELKNGNVAQESSLPQSLLPPQLSSGPGLSG